VTKLSKGARRVYDALIAYKLENDGQTPTHGELAIATDYAIGTVRYYLYALERADLITLAGPRFILVHGARWIPPETAKLCRDCPALINALNLDP